MREYTPDYKRLEAAARNRDTGWIPLYEHLIGDGVIGAVMGTDLTGLLTGDSRDRLEYFRIYCESFKKMGYDTVSWEGTIGETMPGSGALGRHVKGVIQTREDFEAYPWDTLPDRYFETYGQCFEALREALPAGMKAVGGVGNGIFECVQDLVGYEDLCYMRVDDPELYEDLFRKVGENNLKIWQRFLREYGDIYCVCRFGDDLGFKSNTLLPAEEIRTLVIPQYRNIVDAVHQTGKPFLLHSCGQIFGVMDDLIRDAHIDAKHSNEDQIAPFPVWVEKYGDKIGNFGGIDTDAVCRLDKASLREYITDVVQKCTGHGGFAFGSGNSIPDYVPVENYLNMNQIIRELRGE
ncbi:MAG: uroporphyrinogen decarboxylase family protein [Candidatus Avoscillospira sp.]